MTKKGRSEKVEDMHCMISYHKENLTTNIQSFYIHDFSQNNILIPAETAFYVKGGEINSPMRGNIIAVKTEEEVKKITSKYKANPTSWSEIIK